MAGYRAHRSSPGCSARSKVPGLGGNRTFSIASFAKGHRRRSLRCTYKLLRAAAARQESPPPPLCNKPLRAREEEGGLNRKAEGTRRRDFMSIPQSFPAFRLPVHFSLFSTLSGSLPIRELCNRARRLPASAKGGGTTAVPRGSQELVEQGVGGLLLKPKPRWIPDSSIYRDVESRSFEYGALGIGGPRARAPSQIKAEKRADWYVGD